MKYRIIAALLTLTILCSGCGILQPEDPHAIVFYYLEKEYRYGQSSSVIVPEQRDPTGQRRDLSYLMALYLMGPTDDEHCMPLPSGTRIHVKEEPGFVQLELSQAAASLSDSEFSLACACLSMTCFALTEAEEITITSAERTITLTRSALMLSDDFVTAPPTEETQ